MKHLVALLFAFTSLHAFADEPATFKIGIENNRFIPAEIQVPAGQKIKLLVENRDNTSEEFESHALNREKVIPAKSSVTIFIGPLKPGSYPFVGEFHESTAKGVITAK